ncbi:hypothetical protein JAAARDRAFT_27738 [Jaapia argillacea MUCL 33604]|uniref:GRAM domain-containing protein n=1 Tax=Jaapia argillacea MUCL 33604 TaxID=933084 RepID=A0A067QAM5_9AGAM|nr:hypothetical protein JAAARDRAFT_27738 [Jaapia argillacea MUCL 33604]
MALNWTMLSPDRSPIPLPHEQTITTIDSGAELGITIPDAPPTASASAGGSGGSKKLREVGRIWVTDKRLIFVANIQSPKPPFESFSVLLPSIQSTKFEQPYFGANFLTLEVKPASDGGLTEGTKVEIRLRDQGLFGFASLLEKARERAIYMKRSQLAEEDNLPQYTSPRDESPARTPQPILPPGEAPPGYDE